MIIGLKFLVVFVAIFSIAIIIYGIYLIYDDAIAIGVIVIVVSAIFAALIIWVICFWQFNTESGKRALKTQESNFNGGITRIVTVYDLNGNVIKEYKGKFDVQHDYKRILFDDENRNRHIIYYGTGSITIDECK